MSSNRRQAQAGYSLFELIVVLVILGLIVTIAAPRIMGAFEGSKAKVARIEIQGISAALDLYKLSNGAYPTEQQGLKALVEKPDGVETWDGPYLTRADDVNDPWGRPYIYRSPGQHGDVDVSSLGADGREGGTQEDQDLGSW